MDKSPEEILLELRAGARDLILAYLDNYTMTSVGKDGKPTKQVTSPQMTVLLFEVLAIGCVLETMHWGNDIEEVIRLNMKMLNRLGPDIIRKTYKESKEELGKPKSEDLFDAIKKAADEVAEAIKKAQS